MATFNQTQQKYTTTWGSNSTPGFGQTVPQQTSWFPPTSNQWNTATTQQPLFGSTNSATKIEAPKLFGSALQQPLQQPFFVTPKQPLFGSTNSEAPKQPLFGSVPYYNNVALNLTLLPLNLPKNKIEGLIFMVSLGQQNTILKTETLLNNVFNQTKFSSSDLWFTSLIKYSDDKFVLQKIDENHISFALLYSTLLREFMIESIRTPQELYTWLINFAKTNKNKKMLWLFTILKFAEKNQFEDILDMSNNVEVFVMALQTFIRYDNDPSNVVTLALQSTNNLYKTFLLSMVGASYGKEFYKQITITDSNLSDLVAKFK